MKLDRVETTAADRDWLAEDIWASIPAYMHKSIEQAAARRRIAATQVPDYKAGWEALSQPLSWMHDSDQLPAYWGWNLADIANDLIDRAYPNLRPTKVKQ